MNKSQIRMLALDFAHGRVEADDYRERRRRLLDAIEDGSETIERALPPAVIAVDGEIGLSTVKLDARQPVPAPRARLSAAHVAIGAGVVALVAVSTWWLLPAGSSAPPATPATSVATPAAPVLGPARELVENFVATRDFSDTGLRRFRVQWSELPPAQVEEARGAPWFRRLVTTVVQEVKTQKALAELDATGVASDRAVRLLDFGRFLGISEQMLPSVAATVPAVPAGDETPAPAPAMSAAPETTTAPVVATDDTQSLLRVPSMEEILSEPQGDGSDNVAGDAQSVVPATAGVDAAASLAAIAPMEPAKAAGWTPTDGRSWLAALPSSHFTVQLFAVNGLEKVQAIGTRHPQVSLHVLELAGQDPRYRVFFGSYPTAEEAQLAFGRLPAEVRSEQPRAFVRTVADVKASLLSPTNSTRQTAAGSSWTRRQPRDAFTLQLFASNQRTNAERLLTQYPTLDLGLHESATDARSPFRVLYGNFVSAAAARSAFADLPAALTRDIANPIVKPIAELQDSEAPPAGE